MVDSKTLSFRDPGEDDATSLGPPTVRVGPPFLVVLESSVANNIGKLITIERSLTIGRSRESDVVINDPALSRRHIELLRSEGACKVRDLGSRNGTRVNGAAVVMIPLWPGDEIHIGTTLLQFQNGSTNTSDAWARRALTNNAVALWEHFADTDELMFSEHVDPALELPPRTLGQRRLSVRHCVHVDDRERLQRALAAAKAGAPLEIELRLQAPPSLERWVLMRGHQIGTASGSATGTLVDVTALKQREATLTRTAHVFESFVDGVAVTDRDDTIVEMNAVMAEMFGIARGATIGERLFAVIPVVDPRGRQREAGAGVAPTGRVASTLQLGPDQLVEVLVFPLRTERGDAAGAVWVFRDACEQPRETTPIALLDRDAVGAPREGRARERDARAGVERATTIDDPLRSIIGKAEFVRDGLSRRDHEPLIRALDELIADARRIGGPRQR